MCEQSLCKLLYKDITIVITNCTNQTWKKYLSSTALKNKKIFIKCAQIEGAHLQRMSDHYVKFEYKRLNKPDII